VRAAIYTRVSTNNGHQSPEMQLRDLRQLAERRGFEIVGEYTDAGVSGAKDSRPALDAMLADARRGKFRVLLVWRLDRLGRSLANLIRLLENFRAWNVELVSFSEGLDFTTATGKLMFQLLSAFGEFERECIRERVRAGLRNAKARGKRLGRPRVGVDASRIALLRSQGFSWATIAERLDVGEGTVIRAAQASAKIPSRPAPASRCEHAAD
jgi:DNA invertase Pin-like site-specific DNA recombinase